MVTVPKGSVVITPRHKYVIDNEGHAIADSRGRSISVDNDSMILQVCVCLCVYCYNVSSVVDGDKAFLSPFIHRLILMGWSNYLMAPSCVMLPAVRSKLPPNRKCSLIWQHHNQSLTQEASQSSPKVVSV